MSVTATDRIVTYKFRAYPTRQQSEALTAQLAEACRLYNAALQERRDAWRMRRESVGLNSQRRQLKDIRAAGDIGIPSYKIAEDVLYRVEHAFRAFFRRVKAGQRAGYPRFRSRDRYDSLASRNSGKALILHGESLRVSGIDGLIKVRVHRPLMGVQPIVAIKREGRRWFVLVTCRGLIESLPASRASVGLDVGLTSFVAASDGATVKAPALLRRSERELRRAQRKLGRAKLRSRRRSVCRARVSELHRRVVARRRDFAHKLSRSIVDRYGLIAVERLNIAGMARSPLFAKSIHDAGWRVFLNQLAYKAAWAGRAFVEVEAAGTSQTCVCGASVPKTLSVRWHECSACGLSAPRDVVSAMVIEARGRRVQALSGPIGSLACGGAQ
ncbi:MAG TPA: transposase [Vicinamibacterales bacterium]